MIVRLLTILVAGQLLATLFSGQAMACMGPGFEDHHFPSCQIQEPDVSETVTVVTSSSYRPSASVHVGDPTSATAFATIEIAPSEKRHYLILQSSRQVIWNIQGDTDSVSRVLVLGASRLGPWAAGVIGIPDDRITFTSPDLSALDGVMRTSCTRIAASCIASQRFGRLPSDQVEFHPSTDLSRYKVDAFVSPPGSDHPMFRSALSADGERIEEWPVSMPYLERTTEPVTVDPSEVFAPRGAARYEQKTGRAGLDELVASGALLATGDRSHELAVQEYAEKFSARYRTRFDPHYLFVPQVDFVVTQPLKLPADIGAYTFLLAAGVPLPDMNGNKDYRTCFLVMDRASVPAAHGDFKSPYCRENSLGSREPDASVFRAALYADTLKLGSNCTQEVFSPSTEVVVLNVIEMERTWRKGDPLRAIEVNVSRERPVVLYLKNSSGPAEWKVFGTQIAHVYMLGGQSEHSLTAMTLNGIQHTWTRLGVDRDDCPFFAAYDMELRGPTYLHLDKMIETLLGRPISRLVEMETKGSEPLQVTIE